ncbi:MAG TPA: biopolymer transporter ExbD [Verrucomicrobiae bacterium]|nr:biopolymer transporter ExbD [Verrucomicrobiae bacterium]
MHIFETTKTHRTPVIRVINLVDVLFILLIFFIATTTFRANSPTAVKLALPEAKTAEEVGHEKIARVSIAVSSDETIYFDNKPISLSALEQSLREAKEKDPKVQVQFSADKTVSYGTVVAIVDAARAAGIPDITAFTKKSAK